MLQGDQFQKLLYDLFCVWHGVKRHYDPPTQDTEEQRVQKIRNMLCKLLSEVTNRVHKFQATKEPIQQMQDFYEEWTMLVWNVLCVASRLHNNFHTMMSTQDDQTIYNKLNQALVNMVNFSCEKMPFPENANNPEYEMLKQRFINTMLLLHSLYRKLNEHIFDTPEQVECYRLELQNFFEQDLIPCIDQYKIFCNKNCESLWRNVRAAQIQRMLSQSELPHHPVTQLVSFYSQMMYVLAVIGARLQGFRYELTINKKIFGNFDPITQMCEYVFAALELLMSDCVLATEPSTSAILVTNNLFKMNCGALARGVVFKDFEIQVVSEETAEHIQSEMIRQKLLQQPAPLSTAPSAALLAMKPTTGTKRSSSVSNNGNFVPSNESANNTAHKKSDVNSKESVIIYPVYNAKNKYWAANYPHLLCTTRQKGRTSTHNSYQDLSGPVERLQGKRPIFYFHISATMFSPSGRFATAHTLSLPFTIATRRNQDCQVQRMMSSYTATIFWLYGCNMQDGLLLNWIDTGMRWDCFTHLYKQHFKVNAGVQRDLLDTDFELLKYKLQCPDCNSGENGNRINGVQQIVTFKNVLCPHLRYECGSTNVRFSVWRGMLELLQIFHDARNNVKKMWEMGLLLGFLEFDEVDSLLETHKSALIMRLSFVTGGTICFTVKSMAHTLDPKATKPIHLEPLDLKKLQQKCLKDYLKDIADAEKVKYIVNSAHQVVKISDVLAQLGDSSETVNGASESRDISSNITHTGDIDTMQHIKFTAMRIAVVTCKVKPPSADMMEMEVERNLGGRLSALLSPSDDFVRELAQLCNYHEKSKQEAMDILERLSEDYFAKKSHNAGGYEMNDLALGTSMVSPLPQKIFISPKYL
ncbi:hypothetical protein WR25_19695 [Diploscapter pachys]|uniref:Uncharacterized protein n=1 Tax=Diploscapter pachys TaxID=2018661 RepID=A0A2A2JVN0_9BILA|nr:hypothetical protein WR25_19695 [Diploscapter pachys]